MTIKTIIFSQKFFSIFFKIIVPAVLLGGFLFTLAILFFRRKKARTALLEAIDAQFFIIKSLFASSGLGSLLILFPENQKQALEDLLVMLPKEPTAAQIHGLASTITLAGKVFLDQLIPYVMKYQPKDSPRDHLYIKALFEYLPAYWATLIEGIAPLGAGVSFPITSSLVILHMIKLHPYFAAHLPQVFTFTACKQAWVIEIPRSQDPIAVTIVALPEEAAILVGHLVPFVQGAREGRAQSDKNQNPLPVVIVIQSPSGEIVATFGKEVSELPLKEKESDTL